MLTAHRRCTFLQRFRINLNATVFRDVNLSGVDVADCNLAGMKIDGVPVQEALEMWRRGRM